MTTRTRLLASIALALGTMASAALAQNTPATPNPAGVAVSPQTAAEAQQRAVPRNDTGTVVRTGPTAADRTRNAATAVGSAASGAVDSARSTVTNNTTGSGSSGMSGGERAARPDRN